MKITTRQLAFNALLAALCAVLGLVSTIDLKIMKITLQSFPVILAGLLFGPLSGFLVGTVGTFISQALGPYGLMYTTIIWMIPYMVGGFVVGLLAKKKKYHNTKTEIAVIIAIAKVLILILNTLGMLLDASIWGYKSYAFAAIGPRCISCIVEIVIFSIVMMPILKACRRFVSNSHHTN
ncbi:MAG: folate family ECF transporter S component [Eubacteriales bacterium]|nr:folate family ECF transporter S component [Eubacteriales bacterium]